VCAVCGTHCCGFGEVSVCCVLKSSSGFVVSDSVLCVR